MSNSFQPHGLQHAKLSCPSPPPEVCSNSLMSLWWVSDDIQPLSQWRHPTISSSDVPFSSCLQSFPASGSFPMSWLFTSGSQSIGVSASASVLPKNIQGWFPLGFTGLISLLSNGLSRFFSSTTTWKHQFFGLLNGLTLTSIHDYWKNHSFDYMGLCWQNNISAF